MRFQKGHVPWTKGKKRPEEVRRKISEAHKGSVPWNKGKHNYLSEEQKKIASEAHKGKAAWNKGKHHSEQHKKNLSKNNAHYWKGKHLPEEIKKKIGDSQKGKKNHMYGKKHSVEYRKRLSEATRGDRSCHWKGGLTPVNEAIRKSIECRLWRESVFARDGWTCQKCGQSGGRVNAHHIKPFAKYPELRFAINNGITLCVKCHKVIKKLPY